MVFGHRVVDTIIGQVLAEDYEGNTGTRRVVGDGELAATSGWLFQYQFTTSGVRDVDTLEAVFVSDDGEVSEETGRQLVQRASRFDKEESINPYRNRIISTISSHRPPVTSTRGSKHSKAKRKPRPRGVSNERFPACRCSTTTKSGLPGTR